MFVLDGLGRRGGMRRTSRVAAWSVALAFCLGFKAAAQEIAPTPAPTPTASPSASPLPSPAAGATPSPSSSPSPTPTPGPAEPVERPLAPDEIRIRSDRQGGEPGRYRYEGFVDFRAAQLRIQADTLDFIDETGKDGVTTQKIIAFGNVVFMSGDERIAGERLELDIDTGRGFFEKASGYLNPGVFVEADRIERVDNMTYKLEGTRFTACAQENPRWLFSASSATVHMNDKIVAKGVTPRIKSIPIFYLPYFAFPISEEQRSTGFLFPRFGYGNGRGIETGLGFFWAMGRSFDHTFSLDNYSKLGTGAGHEFRYRLSNAARGEFRTYVLRLKGSGRTEYDIDWLATAGLPRRFKASLNVRLYSDILNQQQFQDSLDYASTRTERASINVSGPIGPTLVNLLADRYDTYYNGGEEVELRRHLPQLRISQTPRKIAKTGINFGFEAYAEKLAQGRGTITDEYTRFDLTPAVSRPFSLPFLQVNPRAQFRYTRYGASSSDSGDISGPPVVRQYLESSMEFRGPKFFKIFNTPGNFYSEKFKHAIELEALYTYRSEVTAFNSTPTFDYSDRLPGTDQILYGITNRLYAKRPGPNGKEVTHELLYWRVSQTYYRDISQKQNQFDYTYASAGVVGGEASRTSPIQTRVAIRPTATTSVDLNMEYNLAAKQLATFGLQTRVGSERMTFRGNWNRRFVVSKVDLAQRSQTDTLTGEGSVGFLNYFRLDVSGSYDRLRAQFLRNSEKLKFSIQCCGFAVERIAFNYNTRQDTTFKFQFELAGIGGITSLLGVDPSRQRNGGRY